MALCSHCKKEDTALYENGSPICLSCAELREFKIRGRKRSPSTPEHETLETLRAALQAATERAETATTVFNAVIREIPSGLTHPDGKQRISNASRELALAREEMLKAHNRLNEYVERGTLPEDSGT